MQRLELNSCKGNRSWLSVGLAVACMIFCVAGAARAEELSATKFRPLLDEADKILADLSARKAFIHSYRAESLSTQAAALRFATDPDAALAAARAIEEPNYSSLAIGAIAAQQIDTDPKRTATLLLEAEERALKIDHWTGPDSTSLGYLFQLIPRLSPKEASAVLEKSHENFSKWSGDDAQVKSQPAVMLARAMISVKPGAVGEFVDELARSRQSNHYYESIQLLGRFEARQHSEEAAKAVTEFYDSGNNWPADYTRLSGALIEDALRDLPEGIKRIDELPERDADAGRFAVAKALRSDGRTAEAVSLLDESMARIPARAARDHTWPGQMLAFAPDLKNRWKFDESREAQLAETTEPSLAAARIDQFLADPNQDTLSKAMNPPIVFRNRPQAAKFIEVALPLARKTIDMGYPHHGSPRSEQLGALASTAAKLGDAEQALAIAKEIEIPELRAFYLMATYEAASPLPKVTETWPMRFSSSAEVKVGFRAAILASVSSDVASFEVQMRARTSRLPAIARPAAVDRRSDKSSWATAVQLGGNRRSGRDNTSIWPVFSVLQARR